MEFFKCYSSSRISTHLWSTYDWINDFLINFTWRQNHTPLELLKTRDWFWWTSLPDFPVVLPPGRSSDRVAGPALWIVNHALDNYAASQQGALRSRRVKIENYLMPAALDPSEWTSIRALMCNNTSTFRKRENQADIRIFSRAHPAHVMCIQSVLKCV